MWAPRTPLYSPRQKPLSDVFFLLQKLPTLSHKANACGIKQLSALSEWVCEIAAATPGLMLFLAFRARMGQTSPLLLLQAISLDRFRQSAPKGVL